MNVPRTALCFRAWRTAEAHDFQMTLPELADLIDEPVSQLKAALRGERWAQRLPRVSLQTRGDHLIEARSFAGLAA